MIERLVRHRTGVLGAGVLVTAPAAALLFFWSLGASALLPWFSAAAGAAWLFTVGVKVGHVRSLIISERSAQHEHHAPEQQASSPAFPAWFEQAVDVLEAQAFGADDGAHDRAVRLLEEHGFGIIPRLLFAWVDNAAHRAGIPHGAASVELSFAVDDPDRRCDPEEVPPSMRWAARFIAARIACDGDQCKALAKAVPNNDAWTDNVATVLTMCGQMVHAAWQQATGHVLAHTVAGAMQQAEEALTHLYTRHGPRGLTEALLFWIDETVAVLRERVPGFATVKLGVLSLAAAPHGDRAPVVWATQLFEARAAEDTAQQRELLDEVSEPAVLPAHARSTVRVCATLLNATPGAP